MRHAPCPGRRRASVAPTGATPRVLGLALLAVLLAGCAASDDRPSRESRDASRGPVDLADALPERATTGTYRAVAGDAQGEEFPLRITPASLDADGVFEIEGLRRSRLVRTGDGSIHVAEVIDRREQVRVVYEPAAVMLPDALRVGQVMRMEIEMRVYRLADGSRQASGGGTIELELVEVGLFDTPMGQVEGYRIREHHDLRLSLARVDVRVDAIYARGLGPVRLSTTRRTRTLGLFASEEREVLERIE
ncbi:MAG: hypothetical protein WD009_01480 [Phycisphaeraceae bacterium]